MAKNKPKDLYIVKKGRVPGIYYSWQDCEAQTKGFPDAEFKGFYKDEDEAMEAFMNSETATMFFEYEATENEVMAFTDGSALEGDPAYGVMIGHFTRESEAAKKTIAKATVEADVVLMGRISKELAGTSEEYDRALNGRNATVELHAAAASFAYCIKHGIKELTLVYDLDAVGKLCLNPFYGDKKDTDPTYKAFKKYYHDIKSQLKVNFVRVPSHLVEGVDDFKIPVDDKFKKYGLNGDNCEAMLSHSYLMAGNYNADYLATIGAEEGIAETYDEVVGFMSDKYDPDRYAVKDYRQISFEDGIKNADPKSLAYKIYKGLGLI